MKEGLLKRRISEERADRSRGVVTVGAAIKALAAHADRKGARGRTCVRGGERTRDSQRDADGSVSSPSDTSTGDRCVSPPSRMEPKALRFLPAGSYQGWLRVYGKSGVLSVYGVNEQDVLGVYPLC